MLKKSVNVWCRMFRSLVPPQEGKYMRKMRAQDLWFAILDAQTETGNPYMMFKVGGVGGGSALSTCLLVVYSPLYFFSGWRRLEVESTGCRFWKLLGLSCRFCPS